MLHKADRWLTAFETLFLALGTAVAVGIATVQVVLRYVGGTGLFWAEELTIYTIIWTAFMAAGAGVRTGTHLTVELLQVALGERYTRTLARMVGVLGVLSGAGLAYYGTEFVLTARDYGQVSAALQVPMWMVYLVLPLSGVLLVIRFLQQIVSPVPAAAPDQEAAWP